MKLRIACFVILMVLAGGMCIATAAEISEIKITASDGAADDQFGCSVADELLKATEIYADDVVSLLARYRVKS